MKKLLLLSLVLLAVWLGALVVLSAEFTHKARAILNSPIPTTNLLSGTLPVVAEKPQQQPKPIPLNEWEVAINAKRAEYGLKPIRPTACLRWAAIVRASEMHQSFEHTRPDGRKWSNGLMCGSFHRGENLALYDALKTGITDKLVKIIIEAWENSPKHKDILLAEWARHGAIVRDGQYVVLEFSD